MKALKFRSLFVLITTIALFTFCSSCTTTDLTEEEELYDENSHDWTRNERDG